MHTYLLSRHTEYRSHLVNHFYVRRIPYYISEYSDLVIKKVKALLKQISLFSLYTALPVDFTVGGSSMSSPSVYEFPPVKGEERWHQVRPGGKWHRYTITVFTRPIARGVDDNIGLHKKVPEPRISSLLC